MINYLRSTFFLRHLMIISLPTLVCFCVPSSKLAYLQQQKADKPQENLQMLNVVFKTPIYNVKKGDIINARFVSLNPDKYTSLSTSQDVSQGINAVQEYVVNDSGRIALPYVGSIKVEGLVVSQIETNVQQKLNQVFNDMFVSIAISNFKVTVLGEVLRPGSFPLQSSHISILEALALAGDVKLEGDRTRLKHLRITDGKLTSQFIDLTDERILSSENFYLQTGDILYVQPIKKVKTAQSNLPLLSALSAFVNPIFLITNTILLLTR